METFAVALAGEIDAGWLVDAESAGEAVDIVHGTVPRAHECRKSELLVWNESHYRERYLAGGPFPDSWTRARLSFAHLTAREARAGPGPCRVGSQLLEDPSCRRPRRRQLIDCLPCVANETQLARGKFPRHARERARSRWSYSETLERRWPR